MAKYELTEKEIIAKKIIVILFHILVDLETEFNELQNISQLHNKEGNNV